MTDRPILFSGPMVRALLDGRKTQTRRLAWRKVRTKATVSHEEAIRAGAQALLGELVGDLYEDGPTIWQRVEVGDRLWVREQLRGDGQPGNRRAGIVRYGVDGEMVLTNQQDWLWEWKRPVLSSIHMPRWASRLTLEVTGARVERLQAMPYMDAFAEGVVYRQGPDPDDADYWYEVPGFNFSAERPEDAFVMLWNEIHGVDAWEANPEVVALTFAVHKANIDGMEDAA